MTKIHGEHFYSMDQYRNFVSVNDYNDKHTAFMNGNFELTDFRNLRQRREHLERASKIPELAKLAKELHENRGKTDKTKIIKLKKLMM